MGGRYLTEYMNFSNFSILIFHKLNNFLTNYISVLSLMFQLVFLSQISFVELLIEPTGLSIGFPLVPFLNGIKNHLFFYIIVSPKPVLAKSLSNTKKITNKAANPI